MIVVIDYKVGNVGSLVNMIRKIGGEVLVSDREEDIRRAEKLILPGVGAFDHGMGTLRQSGLIPALEYKVKEEGTPILGICLGMQMLGHSSGEGTSRGLGWIDFHNAKFNFPELVSAPKVPHMGWDTIVPKHTHPLFEELPQPPLFYFVHSYHPICADDRNILAATEYGYSFTSAVVKDNIMGVQFHPEKSLRYGLALLKNFVEKV